MGILWTGLLANLFKYLSNDNLPNLSIRLVNRGLLVSVALARYGRKFHVRQDIKSLE